jgi:hypothetical protein
MEFKIFRRKNVIYVQYRFEPDELKLFTNVLGITSVTFYYRIVCDSEGNAKKFSKGKDQIQALPLALLSIPEAKQAISEAAFKARLLAEEMRELKRLGELADGGPAGEDGLAKRIAETMIKHDLRPTALPGFDAVKIVREGREE